uniref:Uncharacterized protein n=1 Tax=Romanomermis culicivorax TaxID=13658 RepID=A0A915L1C5_ROMCU
MMKFIDPFENLKAVSITTVTFEKLVPVRTYMKFDPEKCLLSFLALFSMFMAMPPILCFV